MLLQRLALRESKNYNGGLKILTASKKPIALSSIDLEYSCDLPSYSWTENFDTHKIAGAWNMKKRLSILTVSND